LQTKSDSRQAVNQDGLATLKPGDSKNGQAVEPPAVILPQSTPRTAAPANSPKSIADPKDVKSASANGSAQQAPPLPLSDVAPEWHRLQMRLSGSMCIACLKDLEDNLKKVAGVDRVRIQRPQTNFYQPISPDVTNWAEAVAVFDGKRVQLDALRELIKQNGYHSYRIVDRILDRDPIDRDLKL